MKTKLIKSTVVLFCMLLFQPIYGQSSNNSLHFDGVNDYVDIGAIGTPLNNVNTFSIEFWMRADATDQPSGNRTIFFGVNHNNTGANGLLINLGGNGPAFPTNEGFLHIDLLGTTLVGSTFIGDDECHHIAVTFSGTELIAYVDGEVEITQATGYTLSNNYFYSLGQEYDAGAATSQFYKGEMDDIRIWRLTRDIDDIVDDMEATLTGSEPGLVGFYNCNQGTAGGSNPGLSLTNTTATVGIDGAITNFALDGSSSNFIRNNCANCAALSDSLFVHVIDNIDSDTYWTEKIYIPDNTIITVDNATLDITTADIVFGECSGIDFVNGAKLRANNSVFRPCAQDGTWRGLRFDGANDFSSQINENTFKNAEVALHFQKDAEGAINANTFSNCNKSIFVNNSLFTESIIANTFLTNKSYPAYDSCYSFTDANDVIHIHIVSSSFENNRHEAVIISQNSMVMSKQDKIQDVTAVEVFNGVASITENTMTNMTGSIIVQSPQGQINLESNEIESNSVFTTVANSSEQISVWNANGAHVYINSNELKNNRDVPNITRGAILVVRSVNVSIEHNVIDGFDYGISTNASTAINISENVLSSIDETGIFLSESQNKNTNYITCNDVTMVMGQGVSVWTKDVSRRTQISSNCLKDGVKELEQMVLVPFP